MFLTLAFVMVFFGLKRNSERLLFGAGMALGAVYWTKELAAVTYFAFLPFLFFFRGRGRGCFVAVAGVMLMLALHGVLMNFIAGDPMHLIKVVLIAVKRNFVDGGSGEDGAAYYLRYLFFDVRHVGLLGLLAVIGIILKVRFGLTLRENNSGFGFAMLWFLALLIVLSVFPVSLSPLRFTMKQSNYMTLFLAPASVMAAFALVNLPRRAAQVLLGLSLISGILLSGLQQADYRTFGANSKAVAEWARDNSDAVVIGSTNNSSLGNFQLHLHANGSPDPEILSFRMILERPTEFQSRLASATTIYAVIDGQTSNWYAGSRHVSVPLSCWEPVRSLQPLELGFGNLIAERAAQFLTSSGFEVARKPASMLFRIATPQPAVVYRVRGSDIWCGATANA